MSTDQLPPAGETRSDAISGNETNDLESSPDQAGGPISAGTIAEFLIGRRGAILKVANSKQATWLALSFVVCAGFFREYDQEDLWHEPWYLLIPVVASTLLAGVLYGTMMLNSDFRTGERASARQFRSFLTCFWMCAPMAALYAVPVETLYDPVTSVKLNITFLLIVSLWRVLLISRILSVLLAVTFWQALFPVMLMADSVAVALVMQIRLPIIAIMGGIQLSEAEQIIVSVRNAVIFWGIVSWPFWMGGTLRHLLKKKSAAEVSQVTPQSKVIAVGATAWITLGLFYGGILYGASIMQPLQQRAYHYEKLIAAEKYDAAIAYVAAHDESDFPAAWDPPPELGRDEDKFLAMLKVIEQEKPPQWFLDRFTARFHREVN